MDKSDLKHAAQNQKDSNKFKAYDEQLYDEEEQLLLQQQQFKMEEETMTAAAADTDADGVKGKRSSLQQVFNVNSISNISSSHSFYRGINSVSCCKSSCSRSSISGGTTALRGGGYPGNIGESISSYTIGCLIPISQQNWQTKYTSTIKQVLMVLVPFLTLPDLVSLSLSCTGLANTTDVSSTFPFSAVESNNITSEAVLPSVLTSSSAAPTTLRNRMHVRTILDTNFLKIISRFKLSLEALQLIFKIHPGTVLSGSSILQAYLGEQYESYDLDFYVPLQEGSEQFLKISLRMHATEYHSQQGTIDYLARVTPVILTYCGLPTNQYYSSFYLKYSEYFPTHQGFILEMSQEQQQEQEQEQDHAITNTSYSLKTLNKTQKIQFIFVKMGVYHNPPEQTCGFVINHFDLSVVKSFYDGNRFHTRCISDILNRSMKLSTQYQWCNKKVNALTMIRIIKYAQWRNIRFQGPFLQLTDGAKVVYLDFMKAIKKKYRVFKYKVVDNKEQTAV